jgi:integrase
MKANLTLVYDRKKKASKQTTGVVELVITSGNVRRYVSTGVQLYPKEWSNGSVVGRRDFKELNDRIQILKKKASEIINQMIEDECFDVNAVPGMLKDKIMQQQTFIDFAKALAKQRSKKLAVGPRKHYDVTFNFLEEWRGLVYFSDLTERNILKMDDELKSRGLKECSRWNYHKHIKMFCAQAVEDGLIKRNPYSRLDIRKGNEDGLKRFLTPAEFHRFETCLIPIDSLRKVRDLFVFQTYTCMAYSDLAEFDYKNCVKVKGHTIYKAKRTKTGQEFTIVLLEPALMILKKYKGKLPIISNVKYNLYLKAAVKYAMIDKSVSTHWARHTGATMLLNEGKVPIHIIQHILGHSSIRETEKTYAKLMDETIVETMVNFEKSKKQA